MAVTPRMGAPANYNKGLGQVVVAQSIYAESSTQLHDIGDRLVLGNRVFYYAKNGAAALSAGFGVQAALLSGATTTLQTKCPVVVAAAASTKNVYITAITTAQTADTFAGGFAVIADTSTTPDDFYTMRVKSNSALATTGTASYITLYDELPVALTTSDFVDLTASPYSGVVIQDASSPGAPMLGVPIIPVTISYYFWLQTYGPCGVYSNEGPLTNGLAVVRSTATDGGVSSAPAANTVAALGMEVVGHVLNVGTDVFGALVFLQIAA